MTALALAVLLVAADLPPEPGGVPMYGTCRQADGRLAACVMYRLEDHAALRAYVLALERAARACRAGR